MVQRRLFTLILIVFAGCFAPCIAAGVERPVVSFIRANIGDSAKTVMQRAFDVLLRDAVVKTKCLDYVNTAARDSMARQRAATKEPFTFLDMRRELGVRYGAFFSLERYGYLVRLATKVVDDTGTVLERTDLALLQASDTLQYNSPFEAALRRLLGRVASALAMKVDSSCPIRTEPILPMLVGGVALYNTQKGFGLFLADNATRVCNLALARMSDTLRFERRFLVVDIHSRDQLFGKLGEYGIQNTALPSAQEIALLNAVGVPIYLIAEVDSADSYRQLHVYVHAFSTAANVTAPLATSDKIIDPDLEILFTTLNTLAYEVALKMVDAK